VAYPVASQSDMIFSTSVCSVYRGFCAPEQSEWGSWLLIFLNYGFFVYRGLYAPS